VTLYPCSACGARPSGIKLSSVTWAWNNADGQRSAWRQRLCAGCYAQRILSLPLLAPEAALVCPLCGIGLEPPDMDPVYATSYVPGFGKIDHEWPTCGACAVQLRSSAQENALRLEDRRDQFGGLGPGPRTDTGPIPAADVWASLGLRP